MANYSNESICQLQTKALERKLKSYGLDHYFIEWIKKHTDLTIYQLWCNCPRADWMLSLIGRYPGKKGSDVRRKLILVASKCFEGIEDQLRDGGRELLSKLNLYGKGDKTINLKGLENILSSAQFPTWECHPRSKPVLAAASYAIVDLYFLAVNKDEELKVIEILNNIIKGVADCKTLIKFPDYKLPNIEQKVKDEVEKSLYIHYLKEMSYVVRNSYTKEEVLSIVAKGMDNGQNEDYYIEKKK